MIYHITHKKDWESAMTAGVYAGDTLGTEGFIHCSDEEQVISVANARFKGAPDLVLLCIVPERVGPEIIRENLEGGLVLFPHIYGPLNLDAVATVIMFEPGDDGCFNLPPNLPR